MQTEARVERDSESLQSYVEVLERGTLRPFPFAKLAAFAKLGILKRRLATAISRAPSAEHERAEAAASAVTSTSWTRRLASSPWGARVLIAAALFGGQQVVLVLLWVLSAAYTNLTNWPASVQTGYLPPLTRFAVVILILFVFAYYFVTPFVSVLLIWGGRVLRSWKMTVPTIVLLLLGASLATFFTFKGLQNPYFAADSVHQFIETRNTSTYEAYEKWLDLNWLLKDPKFKADYELYLRNGPGRWLMNRFDTSDPGAWADPQSLVHIGEFVDQQHDQNKFREWLRDYVERNRINSRGIDQDIDTLVGPANQRFLSIWQAEPYLHDRDLKSHLNYFSEVHRRVRLRGLAFFGSVVLVWLLAYLVGPALTLVGMLARMARLSGLVEPIARLRAHYYAFPEADELLSVSPGDSAYDLLARVLRGKEDEPVRVFRGSADRIREVETDSRPGAGLLHALEHWGDIVSAKFRPVEIAGGNALRRDIPIEEERLPGDGDRFPLPGLQCGFEIGLADAAPGAGNIVIDVDLHENSSMMRRHAADSPRNREAIMDVRQPGGTAPGRIGWTCAGVWRSARASSAETHDGIPSERQESRCSSPSRPAPRSLLRSGRHDGSHPDDVPSAPRCKTFTLVAGNDENPHRPSPRAIPPSPEGDASFQWRENWEGARVRVKGVSRADGRNHPESA